MVMATPPSPQEVGREFVRQYYTVLHDAPDILHRFYSSGSTFVHGGVDRPGMVAEEPVVGQFEIDKKIKQLNFKDCHTKIRQVDSHSTIGNGVVVQVTGELSNNGEPMRRFMQTFVLAPQTPKKFYVHNDIFRYQDEVFQDNSDSESEDQPQQVESSSQVVNTSKQHYYESNEQQLDSGNTSEVVVTAQQVVVQQEPQQQPPVSPAPVQQVEQHLLAEQEEANKSSTLLNGHSSNAQSPYQQQEKSRVSASNSSTALADEAKENQRESKQESTTSIESKNSWAKIISNNAGGASVSTSSMSNLDQNVQQQQQQSYQNQQFSQSANSAPQKFKENKQSSQKQNGGNFPAKNSGQKPRGGQQQQQSQQQQQAPQGQQQQSQQQQQQQSQQRGANVDANSADDADKRFGRYPDGQQVFVGNLSQDLSEAELRAYFGQYGKVLEVRINTNTKQQSGRRLPNYGFVVFDEKQSVDALLSASKANSLTYKNEKGEYRLNVEEKRARQARMSSGFGGNSNSKPNRVTRSSSNGSRGGQANGNESSGNRNVNKKSNYSNNTHSNETGYQGNNGFRKDGHDNPIAADGGGGHRKNNPPRRS